MLKDALIISSVATILLALTNIINIIKAKKRNDRDRFKFETTVSIVFFLAGILMTILIHYI